MTTIKDYNEETQRKMMPIAIGTVLFLIVAFVTISLFGILKIREQLNNSPNFIVDATGFAKHIQDQGFDNNSMSAALEEYVLASKYHQARVLTLTNVITQYFGFLTGMILALIGCVFILSKIREDISDVELKDFIRFKITSSSPGIILTLFGTILILSTINIKHTIDIRDDSIYFKPPVNVSVNYNKQDPIPFDTSSTVQANAKNRDTSLLHQIMRKYGK
jgi:hypothetical protein